MYPTCERGCHITDVTSWMGSTRACMSHLGWAACERRTILLTTNNWWGRGVTRVRHRGSIELKPYRHLLPSSKLDDATAHVARPPVPHLRRTRCAHYVQQSKCSKAAGCMHQSIAQTTSTDPTYVAHPVHRCRCVPENGDAPRRTGRRTSRRTRQRRARALAPVRNGTQRWLTAANGTLVVACTGTQLCVTPCAVCNVRRAGASAPQRHVCRVAVFETAEAARRTPASWDPVGLFDRSNSAPFEVSA